MGQGKASLVRAAAAAASILVALLATAGCIQIQVGEPPAPRPDPTKAPSSRAGLSLDFTWTPDLPRAGEPVRLQAEVEGLAGRSVDEWTWDLGDGKAAKGPAVTHVFAKAGERTVGLRALASDGTVLQASHSILVLAQGRGGSGPVASAGGNGTAGNATQESPLPPPGEFTCPEGPVVEPYDTFGRDDSLPGLAWAALKTGFRFAVVWSTEEPTTETLRYSVAGGPELTVTELAPTRVHLFALEGLPEGKTICFRAGSAPLHAARLANAMTAFQPAPATSTAQGTYTLNVMVLVNEAGDLTEVEPGMDRFAQMIWDATDGGVRVGAMLIVAADYAHHNVGWPTCGLIDTAPVVCNNLYDAIVTEAANPAGAASTNRQGIREPQLTIWMNLHWQAVPGPLSLDDFGAVLTHEAGHYVFDMDDLYGSNTVVTTECYDETTGVSIMAGDRSATEFDDPMTPCPNQPPGYTTSWEFLQGQFPEVADRPTGPVPGPEGNGRVAFRHTYRGV